MSRPFGRHKWEDETYTDSVLHPHRGRGWDVPWHRGLEPSKVPREGSVDRTARTLTLLHTCLPQDQFSMVGAWPDQVQGINQPLQFPVSR